MSIDDAHRSAVPAERCYGKAHSPQSDKERQLMRFVFAMLARELLNDAIWLGTRIDRALLPSLLETQRRCAQASGATDHDATEVGAALTGLPTAAPALGLKPRG